MRTGAQATEQLKPETGSRLCITGRRRPRHRREALPPPWPQLRISGLTAGARGHSRLARSLIHRAPSSVHCTEWGEPCRLLCVRGCWSRLRTMRGFAASLQTRVCGLRQWSSEILLECGRSASEASMSRPTPHRILEGTVQATVFQRGPPAAESSQPVNLQRRHEGCCARPSHSCRKREAEFWRAGRVPGASTEPV